MKLANTGAPCVHDYEDLRGCAFLSKRFLTDTNLEYMKTVEVRRKQSPAHLRNLRIGLWKPIYSSSTHCSSLIPNSWACLPLVTPSTCAVRLVMENVSDRPPWGTTSMYCLAGASMTEPHTYRRSARSPGVCSAGLRLRLLPSGLWADDADISAAGSTSPLGHRQLI